MMFAVPTEEYEVDPNVAEALDLLLILHCRPRAERLDLYGAASSAAPTPTCTPRSAPGSARLWGPLHGGANEAVINTLERIVADGGDVQKWVDRAKDPNHSFRLAGSGIASTRTSTRATIIKKAA
jgi:citrate synthase